ncbi:zinc transporter 1-like isoform X2 [Acanthaster planci]|uniref:Zinc transporter 1-like isoform X2 n=1 Tax=Acanthaster planci TaxID=133434 RepID=A0A8B7ZQW1_ACAPL|nr:zinc transporter 1-like isoform X2 [Acanthaster planci]
MGRYTGKSCRFMVMISLTTSFFLVELITGYVTNSLALVSDSFHMLSDIIALIIGFLAMRVSKKTTPKNTFGWQRSEVLGALVNAVFLMALSFTIFVEAIQRFIVKEEIENPMLVLIVGVVGLVVNGIGLCLFSTHGMSHGHSHGGGKAKGHSHKPKKKDEPEFEQLDERLSDSDQRLEHESTNQVADVKVAVEEGADADTTSNAAGKSAGHLNMRGVFLHVLGDALGSVVVIVSALIIWFTDFSWKHYVDPAMSLIIVAIITITAIPLLKQSSMILLQSIPTDIDLKQIERELVQDVQGIANVHELHVWQLSGNKYIATAHILFHSMHDYTTVAQQIKSYLHDQGIHSTTIQPEFIEDDPGNGFLDNSVCKILCKPNSICDAQKCCGERKSSTKRKSVDTPSSPTEKSQTDLMEGRC